MITVSDNIVANGAYDWIGRGPTVNALARRAGMSSFTAAGYWAYLLTSARDQVLFFTRLERLTPPRVPTLRARPPPKNRPFAALGHPVVLTDRSPSDAYGQVTRESHGA